MLHETKIFKNSVNAWIAESTIDLQDNYILTIRTSKASSESVIRSIASVAKKEGMFLKHVLHTDYYVLVNAEPCNRVTKNAIEKCHIFALGYDLQILEQVKNHYNFKG